MSFNVGASAKYAAKSRITSSDHESKKLGCLRSRPRRLLAGHSWDSSRVCSRSTRRLAQEIDFTRPVGINTSRTRRRPNVC